MLYYVYLYHQAQEKVQKYHCQQYVRNLTFCNAYLPSKMIQQSCVSLPIHLLISGKTALYSSLVFWVQPIITTGKPIRLELRTKQEVCTPIWRQSNWKYSELDLYCFYCRIFTQKNENESFYTIWPMTKSLINTF